MVWIKTANQRNAADDIVAAKVTVVRQRRADGNDADFAIGRDGAAGTADKGRDVGSAGQPWMHAARRTRQHQRTGERNRIARTGRFLTKRRRSPVAAQIRSEE